MPKPHLIISVFHIIRIAERLALNFLGGVGAQLHEELVTQDKLNRDTSYMAGKPLHLPHKA